MNDQASVDQQAAPSDDKKIICHIDNARVHSIQVHISKNYQGEWTVERYQAEFPGEPLFSEAAIEALKIRASREEALNQSAKKQTATGSSMTAKSALFHELFGLGKAAAALNSAGGPITITIFDGHTDSDLIYLPDVDNDYVYSIDLLKKVIIGFELNMPTYLWGFHGTGKTTILEQAAARTRRPFVRVQHTINMQESDVLGQWTVKNGETVFLPGPLPMALMNGWVYCADEYDFAMPAVTSVYQPVLEGKALLIKDAPPQFRKIEPHPNFRFVATGNTNGIGDETGLYQGTLVQNAANYSRFKITEEVVYMEPKIEESILIARTKIDRLTASKIVKFANEIRKGFRDGKLTMTVSPRELITAAAIGIAYGANWSVGLELAFANRLSRVDKKVAMEFAQRIFSS